MHITPILAMALMFSLSACGNDAPKGDLVYCSYSATHHGGLGKDYCELIADPDTVPVVNVRLNIGNDLDPGDVRAEYPIDAETVKSLQSLLEENKVYELNGYNVDEALCGGTTYRIYMEYSSGDKVNAVWFGHNVKNEAYAAYALIERFFEPWRKKATENNINQ